MNQAYPDIVERLGAPQWWDEVGVPRYCTFAPHATNNIYARQAVLMEIACQSCGRRFLVALTAGALDDRITDVDGLHYGDPPHTSCCPAGPTMNSVPLRVVEFWERYTTMDWERQPALERSIACEWA